MPGTIRVSVLEAVDLPEVITDGAVGKDVTAIVTLGPKLFKTQPGVADGDKIASWNSDFAFPVMNLRDKLVISICDSEDHSMTQTAIEIPSIIQKGSRDEFVPLNKGGRIHLRMNFVLTEEERKKIETMRVAALKRKEEAAQRLKKTTVIMQPVTPEKDQRKKPPVSTVAIAEVDERRVTADKMETTGAQDSPTPAGDKKTSTPKRASSPKPMFNYAKAVGVPPSAGKKKPSAFVADSPIGDDAPRAEENTSESTTSAPSVETVATNAESVTKPVDNITPGEVVEVVPRNAESVTETVDHITPGEVVEEVPRNAEPVTKTVDNITPGEVVEEIPRSAESLTKAVDYITPGEVVEVVPRNAASVLKIVDSITPGCAESVKKALDSITPEEVVEVVPRNAESVTKAVDNITPGEVPRSAESVTKAVDNVTPREMVELPGSAESVTKAVDKITPGEVVDVVPRSAESVTKAVDNITPGEVVDVVLRSAESVTKAGDKHTPGEMVEVVPRSVESVTKAVDNLTPGEVMDVLPRNAESVSGSTAEGTAEVGTSTLQDFSWGDEFKATKSSDGVIKAVVEQAAPEEVGHYLSEEEPSSSLIMVSDERVSFSGPLMSVKTVKARLKRTLSRVSSLRMSTSSSSTLTRTRSPSSLVQEVLRRAVSNVKGCYAPFNAAAVHH